MQSGATGPTDPRLLRRWRRDERAVARAEYRILHGALPDLPTLHGPPRAGQTHADMGVRQLRLAVHDLPGDGRTALCLSGGGIRSATFSLGVLQGLARRERLGDFHYLSTVSGGGYAGSMLSSWLKHQGLEGAQAGLGQASAAGEPEAQPLRRIRAYSNYLSPVRGLSLDFLTLLATISRNMVLHWLVLLPLLAALVLLPWGYAGLLNVEPGFTNVAPVHVLYGVLTVAVLLVTLAIAGIASDLPPAPSQPEGQRSVAHFRWAILVPLIVAAAACGYVMRWSDTLAFSVRDLFIAVGVGVMVHIAGIGASFRWRRWRQRESRKFKFEGWPWLTYPAVLLSGGVGGALTYGLFYLASDAVQDPGLVTWFPVLAVPVLLGIFGLGMGVYAGLMRLISGEDDREWWARAAAWILFATVAWAALSMLVLQLPRALLAWLPALESPTAVGLGGSTVLGLLTALAGYGVDHGKALAERAQSWLMRLKLSLLDVAAVAFIALLIALFSVIAADVAALIRDDIGQLQAALRAEHRLAPDPSARIELTAFDHALARIPWWLPLAGSLICLSLSGVLSMFFGINTFSLHGMYGNRLVRAYLGATRMQRQPNPFTGFDDHDNPRLHEMLTELRRRKRLLHIVNVAANAVRPAADRLEWQQRKAASFTMSPLHCGGPEFGYIRTRHYGGSQGGLSLGRAMTISGAAASPNMGYSTSAPVAFVMSLFNVRLGWWLPNPRHLNADTWKRSEPVSGLRPLIDETLGQAGLHSPYLYLSDGGHFDNLGLYEMVRRRCRHIVVVDASCDPDHTSGDLQSTLRRIRVDFGIGIDLQVPERLAELPGDRRRFYRGVIRYSDVDGDVRNGVLIYIKPVLRGDEPLDVKRYASEHASGSDRFPHQSTADQFFDEAQFESYRHLGLITALEVFPDRMTWPAPVQAAAAKLALRRVGTKTPPVVSTTPASPAPDPVRAARGVGISDLVDRVGGASTMAAALGVGSILVAGTVALAPDSRVALAEADRTLVSSVASQAGAVSEGQKKISDALLRLEGTLLKLVPPSGGAPAASAAETSVTVVQLVGEDVGLIRKDIASIRDELQGLQLKAGATDGLGLALDRLENRVHELAQRPPTGTNVSIGQVGPDITQLQKDVQAIRNEVANTNPRRNVRGVEGGGR